MVEGYAMNDFQAILVALFTLAIVAVIVSNSKTVALINAAGSFLTNMVQKVENA